MHKRMGCKADGEDEHRSNLMVVRISSNRPTQQTAFYAPRYNLKRRPASTPKANGCAVRMLRG